MRGFKIGHIVSDETKKKIGDANRRQVLTACCYCREEFTTKPSRLKRNKRIFCGRDCYSKFRAELMPKEEQNAYGTGYSKDERNKRVVARARLNHYLRDNHIERPGCEICGRRAEAHHENYDMPLDIKWLCFDHHRQLHKIHDNPELIGG